jgi:polar amino acid transport system substrate-binding protein
MRRRTLIRSLVGATLGLLGIRAFAQAAPPEVIASLAPTGRIRVAINYGNAALAVRDPATGKLSGVSVDIAEELGKRVGVPVTLVPFDAAGKVSAAVKSNAWDVAFLARDPERAREIAFTAAYVVIDGNYVVRKDSPITSVAQVDSDGVRIAVSTQSAYDLFLTRTLKHAQLFRGGTTPQAIALFLSAKYDVVAGVRQAMQQFVASDPTVRMIPEPFMEINQAMGTPAGRDAGSAYLSAFVEIIKSNGFVAQTLTRNGQADATIAPPG